MQQLLRDWEANVLAKLNSAAPSRSGRARTKSQDPESPLEQPAELLFVPCPCDNCDFRQRCATGLACERYSMFLDGGGRKRWEAASCEPTHDQFEALLG